MKIKYLFFFALMLSSTCLFAQKQYTLQSPDANITVTIDADDELTYSVMQKAISETQRRRSIQEAYNKEHNITPKTIIKEIRESVHGKESKEETKRYLKKKIHTQKDKERIISAYEKEMRAAAKELNFERAAELRDLIIEIKAGE